MNFHFLYKNNSSDLRSRGVNISADDITTATKLFHKVHPDVVLLSVSSEALIEQKMRNDDLKEKVPSSVMSLDHISLN